MTASDLTGRVALVTGSSSGIGEATARALSERGATVVVNSSSSVEAGKGVVDTLPAPSIYIQADIGDPNQCRALVKATVDSYGRLDILVNNAGWTTVVPHHELDELTDEIFLKTFDINVFGTWSLTKSAIPHLMASDDPNVVTITSIAGVRPVGSSIAYSMSKAALNQMTVLLAKSYAPIRFNAVAPGLVETPWTSTWDAQHEWVGRNAPLGRSASAEDCADAVMGLLGMRYATGQIVVVDGGLTIAT